MRRLTVLHAQATDTPAERVPTASDETPEDVDVVSVGNDTDKNDISSVNQADSDAGSVSSDEWALEPSAIASRFGTGSGEKVCPARPLVTHVSPNQLQSCKLHSVLCLSQFPAEKSRQFLHALLSIEDPELTHEIADFLLVDVRCQWQA